MMMAVGECLQEDPYTRMPVGQCLSPILVDHESNSSITKCISFCEIASSTIGNPLCFPLMREGVGRCEEILTKPAEN